MKRTLLFTIVVTVLLVAMPVTAQDVLTPGETLVMDWIEASVHPLNASELSMLAPDFVFYDTFGSEPKGVDVFLKLNHISFPGYFNTFVAECVVKGEHDLVEATYLLKNDEPYLMPAGLERTILFRIENGMIAEAWLDHSL